MKISIITVVFNNEATIREAIESVLNQSYKDIEYIVIDGKSTDNTTKIIKEYQSRLGFYVSEVDKGLYDAMNKGIISATGDVIGILNSDDLYQDEHVIGDVMRQFMADPELDILYGNLAYVKNDDPTKIVRNWVARSYYKSFFEDGNVPPHPSLFLRNRVYNSVGLFNLQYKLAADYEFMFRLFKKFEFKSKYLPRLMVRMRLGGATNKNIGNIVAGNKEILQAWTNNGFRIPTLLMPLRIIKRLAQFLPL